MSGDTGRARSEALAEVGVLEEQGEHGLEPRFGELAPPAVHRFPIASDVPDTWQQPPQLRGTRRQHAERADTQLAVTAIVGHFAEHLDDVPRPHALDDRLFPIPEGSAGETAGCVA